MICILRGRQTTSWPVLYRMSGGMAQERFIHDHGQVKVGRRPSAAQRPWTPATRSPVKVISQGGGTRV
jgi:hypothetical protein